MEPVDILVFGAHADDVELSCGGTIASAVALGRSVGIVDLTRGEMGTRGTPAVRAREASEAASILGASFRETLDFGDGNLRAGREEEMQIIAIVRLARPSIVIAPLPDERHPDHVRAGRLVTEASFYAGLRKIETGQPAHRPQAVVWSPANHPVDPSFIVDVSAQWETKMRAVAAYRSQFHDPSSNEPETFISARGFIEMIEARGKHFGSMIGAARGEPYVTRLPPRIDDIVAAYQGREV